VETSSLRDTRACRAVSPRIAVPIRISRCKQVTPVYPLAWERH
jgi:hypothetical protein